MEKKDDLEKKSNLDYDTNNNSEDDKKNETEEELQNPTDTNEEKIENETNKEEELLDEISSLRDEKIRLLAEMENLRKRFEREKAESIKFGSISLAREILSPGDNIERALKSISKEEKHSDSVKNLIEGLKMVQKEFITILENNGIKKINSLNNKFDHNFHQAMMEIEDNEKEEGTVIQEIQTGYTMHDRLLRPAMVGVSKKPKNNITEENQEKLDQDKA